MPTLKSVNSLTQLDANRAIAAKAIDKFCGPEVRQILEQSGLGNHPALVRAFVRIGKTISEDSISGAAAGGKGEPSKEEVLDTLYPSMSKRK